MVTFHQCQWRSGSNSRWPLLLPRAAYEGPAMYLRFGNSGVIHSASAKQTDWDEKSQQVAMTARVIKQVTGVRASVGEHVD